jgi:hypothetical protein
LGQLKKPFQCPADTIGIETDPVIEFHHKGAAVSCKIQIISNFYIDRGRLSTLNHPAAG